MIDPPRTINAIVAVSIVSAIMIVFYCWLFIKCKKQSKGLFANIKKYSGGGDVWKGEKIPIDPENWEGNLKDGISFFHPITGYEYPCISTEKTPEGSTESYVQAEYLVGKEFSVVYRAYLYDVPLYVYRDGVVTLSE